MFNRYNISWIIGLGAFFFLSYGAINHLSAWMDSLNPIQSYVFSWEKEIPFIPAFIYPYMSIDFLYGLAFFIVYKKNYNLITYRKMIHGLGLSLLINQLFSLICFVAFPLKFSFIKPEIPEHYAYLFNTLLSFDLPYNQTPSLHISILIILSVFYNQHIKKAWVRFLLNIWFVAIGLSVLTTYQHHFIDVLMGGYLGLALVLMFNYSPTYKSGLPFNPHSRQSSAFHKYCFGIGLYAIILFILPTLHSFGMIHYVFNSTVYIVLWVAFISLITMFKIMFYGTHFDLRKQNGSMRLSFLIVGEVYFFFRNLCLYFANYYTQPIALGAQLYVGNTLCMRKHKPQAQEVIFNVAVEINHVNENISHYGLTDLVLPTPEQLHYITGDIYKAIKAGKIVYIHCALGIFRTMATSIFYLYHYEHQSMDDIFLLLEKSQLEPRVKQYIKKRRVDFESIALRAEKVLV